MRWQERPVDRPRVACCVLEWLAACWLLASSLAGYNVPSRRTYCNPHGGHIVTLLSYWSQYGRWRWRRRGADGAARRAGGLRVDVGAHVVGWGACRCVGGCRVAAEDSRARAGQLFGDHVEETRISEAPAPRPEDAPDFRPLYERLQEMKDKKDSEWKEKNNPFGATLPCMVGPSIAWLTSEGAAGWRSAAQGAGRRGDRLHPRPGGSQGRHRAPPQGAA